MNVWAEIALANLQRSRPSPRDMANDAARYHALGIDFRKDDKIKKRALVMRSNVELPGAASHERKTKP